jgi:hypothetical protein
VPPAPGEESNGLVLMCEGAAVVGRPVRAHRVERGRVAWVVAQLVGAGPGAARLGPGGRVRGQSRTCFPEADIPGTERGTGTVVPLAAPLAGR